MTGTVDRELMRAAIALLARRDFGRAELGRRLIRRLEGVRFSSKGEPSDDTANGLDRSQWAPTVEAVLDALQAKGLLSDARFAHEYVRARASRFGPVRLRHDLQRRGVPESMIDSALRGQQGDEFARARALWLQRFGQVASAAPERARQARFLAARGFSHDIVRRLIGGRDID